MPDRTQITVERIGHHGDGIGAGPVFIPGGLPGERVSGVLEGYVLTDIRIEVPVADRVAAPCTHYKSCGGCQMQHANDVFVAKWKQAIVEAALESKGLTGQFRPIHVSPIASRRRATFSARRTKKGATAGFHARKSDTIIETPNCAVIDAKLKSAIPIVRELALLGASRKGEISVTVTTSDAGLDVAVDGGKELDTALRLGLARLAETAGLARLTWSNEMVAMRAAPFQMFGAARVVPPPGAFLQSTPDGEAVLRAAVTEICASSIRCADLFAGSGTFTLPLAERAHVHAVEGSADMLTALKNGWRHARGLKQVTTEARDLFRRPLLAEELSNYDAIVLDPPRAGADAQVKQIAGSGVPKLAYVSCNPVSFARDAAHLVQAGYRLNWVQVVDQFRWSRHVELVAYFSLSHMSDDRKGIR